MPAALLVIDVQQGFDEPYWGKRNNPQCEDNIAALIAAFRRASKPVIHVQHMSVEPQSPLRPGQPGNEFKPAAAPAFGEKVFGKTVNSAFIGTELEKYLREQGIDELVICGLTTDHCVSTSTRMAGNLGFKTYLVSDATATFNRKGIDGRDWPAEEIHQSALASLNGEFAQVISTVAVLNLF
ncbi:cysteine hydrolase [bacterium]|nr:cysteine hydrolase [bacterium]